MTTFSSDHIKYHLHYSSEYLSVMLKKLVNDGTILENDTEYLRAVAVGDLAKARGLENMDRLIARDPVYAAMVYV